MTDIKKQEWQGVQGWKQFLSSKLQLLDKYDRAKEYSKAHEVETYHGIVAEQEFRNWLSGYLPKKYGVTSGYVISQGLMDHDRAPHFDVIIYDRLNSPVLWSEDHSGLSLSGQSQAIPSEYVLGVLEVKSKLSSETARKSLEHLLDLQALRGGQKDGYLEGYQKSLPDSFFCGTVFFEVCKDNEFSKASLNNLISNELPYGYLGGLVLRAEGKDQEYTGRIKILRANDPMKSNVARDKASLITHSPLGDSIQFADGCHINTFLIWNTAIFAEFANDLVALLKGEYDPRIVSSFHGMNWNKFTQRELKQNNKSELK